MTEGLRPAIRRNFDQIFDIAEVALSKGAVVPALMLVYSAIDIAAGLARTEVSSKRRFVKWVDQYISPAKTLSCSALDLYGARCGLAHGSSPVSDLSQRGEAKQIVYSWGESGPEKLREMISLGQRDHYVAIHADGLLESARRAVDKFLREVTANTAELQKVNRKALFVFANLTEANINVWLEWGREKLGRC